MPIVYDAGEELQTYRDQHGHTRAPRPAQCPHCQAAQALVGHGCYPRKALAPTGVYEIFIRRWRCTACGKTVAMLPSFLLRFRWYLLTVIQAVLVSRHEAAHSWTQVEAQATVAGAPSRRTIQRWDASFQDQAPAWLALLQQSLARYDSASPWLDPLGEAVHAGSAARALLDAAVHFLAWAQSRWPVFQHDGLTARLRVLWQWGYTHGLARLV